MSKFLQKQVVNMSVKVGPGCPRPSLDVGRQGDSGPWATAQTWALAQVWMEPGVERGQPC